MKSKNRCKKSEYLSIDKVTEIINELRKKSISDLHGKDKQDAFTLLNDPKYKNLDVHLYGVIDYRAYYTLNEEQRRELHFIFIDVKNATLKKDISEYLIEKKITSFNLAGDMDIIVNILSTRDSVEKFKEDIAKKFPQAKFEFHTYVALRPLYLEKKKQRDRAPDISQQNISANIISRIQANYTDESLEDAYNTLLQERVLVGHSATYDFLELHQFRDFALIFDVSELNESQFFKFPEVFEHIIDLYEVDYIRPIGYGAEKDYTSFYSGARYLAFLEFTNPKERSTWEKMVGTIFHNSNVFFFPVSNFIYKDPYGTTDIEFDERCNKYSQGSTLSIGNPLRNGESIDRKIGLSLYSINKNGFVLGQPRVGKTTTALRLIECFIKENLTIHLINPTQDLVDAVKKEYGTILNERIISDLQKAKNGFIDFKEGINIFQFENKQSDYECSELILGAIERTPQVKPIMYDAIKKKDNPVNCVLVIDEAHDLFAGNSSKKIIQKFASKLQKISHHGIAMYVITQQISHLKRDSESLIPALENRIFHQMTGEEAKDTKGLLLQHETREDSIYNRIDEEITKLPKGRVFLRFINQDGKALPPLKVQIFKERSG